MRTSLGRAYAFVSSRSRIEFALAETLDDWRDAALERIEGRSTASTVSRTRRNLTDLERIEEIREGIKSAILVARTNPEFGSE